MEKGGAHETKKTCVRAIDIAGRRSLLGKTSRRNDKITITIVLANVRLEIDTYCNQPVLILMYFETFQKC
jgi:hypothetical protein